MRFVTTSEASLLLGVHKNTIWNLVHRGELQIYKNHCGYGRFDVNEILALREKRKKITKLGNDETSCQNQLGAGGPTDGS